MKHDIFKALLLSLLVMPYACTFADTPTGQDLIQILLDNKDRVISNKDGWCSLSADKPLSVEIIRVLSPHSKFEDNIQEELHYQCSDSIHENNNKAIPVWQCQIGVVETKKKDKEYFTSRSIFFSINKKSKHIYMNSIRCMD